MDPPITIVGRKHRIKHAAVPLYPDTNTEARFMSSKLQISIPQAASWLLRLAVHPQLSDNLCRDAVALSAWYAAANGLLDWPDEVERSKGPSARKSSRSIG